MQLKADIIAAAEPSQLARSVVNVKPSLCLILMVYDEIEDPPLFGAAQVMTTPVLEITEVTGVFGAVGLADARTDSSELKSE